MKNLSSEIEKNFKKIEKSGLYDKSLEHSACGVGLIANIKGISSHNIVEKSLEALNNLEHRGASGADPETGDGAGILIQIPHEFYKTSTSSINFNLNTGEYGTGIVFMRDNKKDIEKCLKC